MRLRAWALGALVAVPWLSSPAAASGPQAVDVALVLAIDVSGSVNDERYQLQRDGYARAFASDAVANAVRAGADQVIAVTLVEWSGSDHQSQVVGWSLIRDRGSALAFSGRVAKVERVYSDWTSLSGAIDYSAALLAKSGFAALRRVIDISGDGVNNAGRPVAEARAAALAAGITINGLPILTEYPELDAYYRDNVIGGRDAFVVVAKDFSVFSNAILGKLVREIARASPSPGETLFEHDQDAVAFNANGGRLEALPEAGTGDAKPVLGPEAGTMRATEQEFAWRVKKLIGRPVER